MNVYLGLGSNEGDRCDYLRQGIEHLRAAQIRIDAVSPVVESPALLPDDAPASWNKPYMNLVLRASLDASTTTAHDLRDLIKTIEDSLGRDRTDRWSPRPLDIDILMWGREIIRTELLTIPHPDLLRRAFVLSPLVHLEPALRIPGFEEKTVLEWSLELRPIPLWMGIINVTPDSFSEGDVNDPSHLGATLNSMTEHGCHILDLGGESTRPGATALDWQSEWARVEPALIETKAHISQLALPPAISIDTRHWQVAERALSMGVDIINDVTGLTDPAMQALAREHPCDWVVMHHLSVPADPTKHLPRDRPAIEHLEQWLMCHLEIWGKAGIDTSRLTFDPGIGFGKDSLQSLSLMRELPRLRKHGLRILVGHSRKSFMSGFTSAERAGRDIETIGASLKLCEFGVDILRVHNISDHIRAYRAWAEVAGF
ncbi:MAG: 2-amino-4-hydroxy-6-hydroxymethyldihydropteridine diphosphokinase/dihydropteroate synthase [Gammaproteobacteria bacterium]|jgi:2-amino-4-hydroxy-6-hydroxymethyldihydropteridine diphosphokinase/dihydropteroate synthase